MRRLTFLVLAAAAIYSLYWFVGASRVEAAARDALAQLQTQGWDIAQTDVNTRGYPSRFDTTFTDLTLSAPDDSFAFATPFAQAFALSYRPTSVILALADTQTLRLGPQVIDIATAGVRASAGVSASPALPLKDVAIEIPRAEATSQLGWSLLLVDALAAVRPSSQGTQNYDAYLGIAALTLDQAPAIRDIVLDMSVQLDRDLDRHLLGDLAPQVQKIEVKSLQLSWDRMRLTGQGSLAVDAAGVPQGEIPLQLSGWQELVPLLVDAGMVAPQMRFTMLAILQNLAAGADDLSLPLRFDAGQMRLGPIPLGPAPRLR